MDIVEALDLAILSMSADLGRAKIRGRSVDPGCDWVKAKRRLEELREMIKASKDLQMIIDMRLAIGQLEKRIKGEEEEGG